MMKTATTYMQSVWLRDSQYALAFRGALPVVQYARASTLDGTFDPKHPINIEIDRQPVERQNIIVSQEGFSSAYLVDVGEVPVRQYIENASKILGTLNNQTNNILLCVRSPVSWIRSMHSQFINEGQYGDGSRFYELKEKFLSSSLDLEFLLKCYQKRFKNVVVLPFEYLRDDEDKFWGILEDKFSVPKPQVEVPAINESVAGCRLLLMSRLNEVAYHMRSSLLASDKYKNKERDMLVNNSQNHDKWFNRRFCQYASDIDVERMCDRIGINEDSESFRQVPITKAFAEVIEEKFLAPFGNLVQDQVLAEKYRQELWESVV